MIEKKLITETIKEYGEGDINDMSVEYDRYVFNGKYFYVYTKKVKKMGFKGSNPIRLMGRRIESDFEYNKRMRIEDHKKEKAIENKEIDFKMDWKFDVINFIIGAFIGTIIVVAVSGHFG